MVDTAAAASDWEPTIYTPFADLDAILTGHIQAVRSVLGEQFIGGYLQGSFALGGGDAQSDCDFIVVTTTPPAGDVERELRRLHDGIPGRAGVWNQNLEGSYPDERSLRNVAGQGTQWLYANRGHRELIWSDHDNTPHTRWILRHHAVVIDGPPIADLVDEVPDVVMRAEARQALPGMIDGIGEWADLGNAWTQRYIVQTYCRVFYTLETAGVVSKPGALTWGAQRFDSQWQPLIQQVQQDRSLPWHPVDPPRPGSLARALEFAAYVEGLAAAI